MNMSGTSWAALLVVSILTIQITMPGEEGNLRTPSQETLESVQNVEIENGQTEKIYLNFQIDSISDLNGVEISIFDLAGVEIVFEFDATGGGSSDEGSIVVLAYAIGTINGTVEEFSSMVDALVWFDSEVVAENVVKITSIPAGDLIDATLTSPTGEISMAIDQGSEPHVLPAIREILRVPINGSDKNTQVGVDFSLATEEGGFVFIGNGHERIDTDSCYQEEAGRTFIILVDSLGVCSWAINVDATIKNSGLIGDSIMLHAFAEQDLSILGNDIESQSYFFGSIGLNGIWRSVFSSPLHYWDQNSMYEIQAGNQNWHEAFFVDGGMIVSTGGSEMREEWTQFGGPSISGCTGVWYAAKIDQDGVCISQANYSSSIWGSGLTKTNDGNISRYSGGHNIYWADSNFENYSDYHFVSSGSYAGNEDIRGLSGDFPLDALRSKLADSWSLCTEGYESQSYTAISDSKAVFIGSVVNDPENTPDNCPMGMFLVDYSSQRFQIFGLEENTRFSNPCEDGATNCVGIIQFGDGFCLVPGSRYTQWTMPWGNGWHQNAASFAGTKYGGAPSDTVFAETCFDSYGNVKWWHESREQLTGHPYCTAETNPSWEVYENVVYDRFDEHSEIGDIGGSLLRTKVVNYVNCNNGNGVHSYSEIIVHAIDPPSKVDDDGDEVMDIQDSCLGTPWGEQVDASGCSWGQADDDGDGFSNQLESMCGTSTNNSTNMPDDIDGDGQCDFLDNDRDGDGTLNFFDAFPDDPNEWGDADGDGIGDNSDEDADGDGIDDSWRDTDEDGFYDHEDAFPYDPNEWSDSDGDGVGDNSDSDSSESDGNEFDEGETIDDSNDGPGTEEESGDTSDTDSEIGGDTADLPSGGVLQSEDSSDPEVVPEEQDSDGDGGSFPWFSSCGLVGLLMMIGMGYNRRVSELKKEIMILRDALDSPNYKP
tara:strand:+ start:339 stop:3146 length:2808 start_codon:yes stop_codon:yes gene_type:complete